MGRLARPTNPSSSTARATAARSSRTCPGGRSRAESTPARVRQWRPASTFSVAESCWKSRTFWKVRAMPARTILLVRLPAMGRPSKAMVPAVTG
jgi:hypothetical protein